MAAGEGSLTLVFDLAALRRLRAPGDAFAAAREWTAHLGLVGEVAPHALTKFARDHGLRVDFMSGPGGVTAETLADARASHDTDRYVYVGAAESQRRTADEADWEYLDVAAAADAAGWDLADADAGDGPDAEGASTTVVDEQRDDWP